VSSIPLLRAENGKILPADTPEAFAQSVALAADWLKRGSVVVLPTETVYGLAASAWNERAIEEIYRLKGRPASNPLIVHVSGMEMAKASVNDWPEAADQLARAFWPGPLTLVLPKRSVIPDRVTAGGSTVAVRWPSHPIFQAVLEQCGFPLAAPSANRSNKTSPTAATQVLQSLGENAPWIVDGGPCPVGIESTVVDVAGKVPRVLRAGMISREAIERVLGRSVGTAQSETLAGNEVETLRSPGLMRSHYAPRADLWTGRWKHGKSARIALTGMGLKMEQVAVISHTIIPEGFERVIVLPNDPEAYARGMYAAWHRCDEEGVAAILVEEPPDGQAWEGIWDRLRRASRGRLEGGI